MFAPEINAHEKIPAAQVTLLWAYDYWDGPLSGMAELNGEMFWFSWIDVDDLDCDFSGTRRYWLIRLSAEQLAQERQWNQLFRKFVGKHMDYDNKGQRQTGDTCPISEWKYYYQQAGNSQGPDLTDKEIIGWFQLPDQVG